MQVRMLKKMGFGLVVCAMSASSVVAGATTLSGNLTADNYFQLYLSNSNATLGTLIVNGSTSNWWTPVSFSTNLTLGQTEYLHVGVDNVGGPGALLGSFSLSGTGFTFSNGAQNLVTNTTNWLASPVGAYSANYSPYVAPSLTPTSDGVNGVSPWGAMPSINSSAQWLDSGAGYTTTWFSTAINKTAPAVPEPESLVMMMAGLVAIRSLVKRQQIKK